MTARDDFDPLAPQREAAFFYGLFLRGHDIDPLRQDIDVPRTMLEKWMKAHDFEASFRENPHERKEEWSQWVHRHEQPGRHEFARWSSN